MSRQHKWTEADISDLSGKIVVITGASSGLGYETAQVLLERNAIVVTGCSSNKAEVVLKTLSEKHKNKLHIISSLDLSDLSSIENFSRAFKNNFDRLDVLINNAGVMNIPYCETKQGFEMQLGVNHLAHFALVGYLAGVLQVSPKSRVVTVSSIAAHDAPPDVLDPGRVYDKKLAYKGSKLCNLYFSLELDRRFKEHKIDCISLAAHPGYARSNLQRHSTGMLRRLHVAYTLMRFGQSGRMGALPILRAATEKDLQGKEYFYPDSANSLTGFPISGNFPAIAMDPDRAKRVWEMSGQLTGVNYFSK